MEEREDDRSGEEHGQPRTDDRAIIVIPFTTPSPSASSFSRETDTADRSGEGQQLIGEGGHNIPDYSTIVFSGIAATPEETVAEIAAQADITPDESLTRLARCGAFWKTLGVETIIYVSSIGGILVANGLVIRFAGFEPFASTLLFGGVGGIAYNNAQLLFTSLLKPPGEKIPENRKAQYGIIRKYAFLPLSMVAKAGVAGSVLTTIGDTSIGTQQAVSAATTPAVGPVLAVVGSAIRSCYGGTIVLKPGHDNVVTTFRRAYGSAPNPADQGRSYRWGTVRDMASRVIALTASTVLLSFNGGFQIETYCDPDGQNALDEILAGDSDLTADDIDANCFFGNFTFMLRELGISSAYAAGLLIIDPLFGFAFNRVYDFFYPPVPDTGDDIEQGSDILRFSDSEDEEEDDLSDDDDSEDDEGYTTADESEV